jgi:hypothetical protein
MTSSGMLFIQFLQISWTPWVYSKDASMIDTDELPHVIL